MKEPTDFPRPLAQRQADKLLGYPPEVLAALRYEWALWQLPHQVAPEWDFDTWLNIGGRGSGKTTGATQELRKDICERGVRRLNFIGRTSASVRDDMVNGEAGIIAAFPPHQRPEYISSQSLVRFHTGAVALMLTAEEPKAIQGKNAERTWCDEFSTYGEKTEEVWDQVCLSTRVGDPRKYITTNSLPENPYLDKLMAEATERKIAVTRSTSFDNFANLPAGYQRQVREMMKTAWGRAWVLGEKFQADGALWKASWFRYLPECPAAPPGALVRTVVAVDPAGTTGGDETGIIVARRIGNNGYVLADLSGHHDSEKWPAIVVKAARDWRAHKIVIERNRGLDFLRALIRPLDRSIPLDEINVTNRKDDRAYPVANLYELGRIFHCPMHPVLERQMTNWDPKSQDAQRARRKATSPDRIDALVHAVGALGFHLAGVARGLAPVDLPPATFT